MDEVLVPPHLRYPWVCLGAECVPEEPVSLAGAGELGSRFTCWPAPLLSCGNGSQCILLIFCSQPPRPARIVLCSSYSKLCSLSCCSSLLVFSHIFWDGDNSETGKQGLQEVNHHLTAFVQRPYRNIFQLHGKWKFTLRTDS